MSQTNKKLRAQLEDCRRAMRAAREAISIAQRYVPMEWKRTMLNSIEYLTEQLDEMKTFDSGLIPDNLNIPKQEYKMADNKHFEPVTARSLTNQIMRVIKGIYLANNEGLRNVEEDIYSTIEPHIRKPSDEDKSVPQRCEEAYNEAVSLLKRIQDKTLEIGNAIEIDRFLQKTNPFKEAEIVDKEEDKTEEHELLPFSIELAAQGHKVVTRDCRPAKIVADNISGDCPVLAVITNDDGTVYYTSFTKDGYKNPSKKEQSIDLFILKEPETLEIHLFKHDNGTYYAQAPGQAFREPEVAYKHIKTITVTI